ncbi:MAG: hypothetical protein ACP5HK_03045 [Acidilobus sp.]
MGEENTCSISIEINVGDPRTAESLTSSLNVDNVLAPTGISVKCESQGPFIRCDINANGCENPRRLLTMRNTVDDLILGLRAALYTIMAVRD